MNGERPPCPPFGSLSDRGPGRAAGARGRLNEFTLYASPPPSFFGRYLPAPVWEVPAAAHVLPPRHSAEPHVDVAAAPPGTRARCNGTVITNTRRDRARPSRAHPAIQLWSESASGSFAGWQGPSSRGVLLGAGCEGATNARERLEQ